MAKTFESWKASLPKCIGFEGGCDGDLVGEGHEDNCPMKGKKFATLEDAFHARDADFAALEQRILELHAELQA